MTENPVHSPINFLQGNERVVKIGSNDTINVAQLASIIGGSGHTKAAGFECHNPIGLLKGNFLKEAGKLLGAF